YAPTPEPGDGPVVRSELPGRTGEARADAVEQRLRERVDLRLRHAKLPDTLQHGVIGRERLRAHRGGHAERRDGNDGRAERAPHGVIRHDPGSGFSLTG